MRPAAICLMGPTASGKTGIAVELVERLPLAIISVDSALVFRDMDIGTAKPEADVLARAPHRLVDFLDPAESYSAAAFREDCLGEMAAITRGGEIPFLVGGTMLYFRALQHGIGGLPEADEQVRARLSEQAKEIGWAAMHARLAQIDPQSASKIHPNDPQRIQRALEIYQLTGKTRSQLHAAQTEPRLPHRLLKLAILPPDREQLTSRISMRLKTMFMSGFVDEVRALRERGDLNLDMPSMRSVGYRQVWGYLDGDYGYDEMVEKAVHATRQLAKRQMTWLRSEKALVAISSAADAELAIRQFLNE